MSTSVFTLKGLGLKCDTAESIEPHLQALKDNDEVTTVVVGGNTFGIGACEELALLLKTKPTLVVRRFFQAVTRLTQIPKQNKNPSLSL